MKINHALVLAAAAFVFSFSCGDMNGGAGTGTDAGTRTDAGNTGGGTGGGSGGGTGTVDAGHGAADSGSTPVDAGTTVADAGAPVDAGAGAANDAGTVTPVDGGGTRTDAGSGGALDAGGGSENVDAGSGGPVDAGTPLFNGCDEADFVTYADAQVDNAFPVSPGIFAYSKPCMLIAVGHSVRFVGTFSGHPLKKGVPGNPSAGTANNPITDTSSGSEATFNFAVAGDFPFYCNFHSASGMKGVVRVR